MCEQVLFADVCTVFQKLSDPFLKPVEKLNYFSRYIKKFDHESPVDLFPLLRLLMPALDRRRPPSQLRQPLLARVYAQVFALPAAAAARLRLYKDPAAATSNAGGAAVQVGDFGSFVAMTLKQRIGRRPATLTVGELNEQLDLVSLATAFPEKIAVLQKLFPQLTVHEHKWFVRILMKEVKLGGLSGERLLTVLHPGARKIINQCSDLQSTLEVIEEQQKANAVHDEDTGEAKKRHQHVSARENHDREEYAEKERDGSSLLFRPLRPMLAQLIRPAAADIQLQLFPEAEFVEAVSRQVTQAPLKSHHYFVERKYDGERLFAHVDRTLAGEFARDVFEGRHARSAAAESVAACVRLFSRRGRDITKQYGGSAFTSDTHCNTSEHRFSEALDSGDNPTIRQTVAKKEVTECHHEQVGEEKGQKHADHTVVEGLRVMLAKALRGSQAILDGELLAWDDERGTFLPFGTNKSVAMSETSSCHLSYVVFDILFYRNTEGEAYDLLSMELKDRKTLLERVLKPVGNRIMLAPYMRVTEAKQIIDRFNDAVRQRHEGIVVKSATSLYHLHSRRGGWYKIKPQSGCLPDTLDLLVLGAFFAETTRRREHTSTHAIDHCSHFLLGVLEGKGGREATRVRSFCRIGSGFSLAELTEIRNFVRPYCRRLPPVDSGMVSEGRGLPLWLETCRLNASTRVDVTWPPSKSFVMEVSAAEIIPSVEFDIEYTLRFAKAVRPFRRDKEWYEAMSENDLQAFFVACEERGGLPISSPETPAGTLECVINSGSVSSIEREASPDETDREQDKCSDQYEDLADEDRFTLEGCQGRGRGERSRILVPAEASSADQGSALSGISSMSTNVRSRKRIRQSMSRHGNLSAGRIDPSIYSISPRQFHDICLPAAAASPGPLSAALRGQCVWVLEGENEEGDAARLRKPAVEWLQGQDAKPTKTVLQQLVAELGGTVASAFSREVTHIIASRRTFRSEAAAAAAARAASSSRTQKRGKGTAHQRQRNASEVVTPPVLHYQWLLDCARLNALAPIRPAHVLHGTPKLAGEFAGRYDKYGDAFFEPDTSPRSLLRVIESAAADKEVDTGNLESDNFISLTRERDADFDALQEETQDSPSNAAHYALLKECGMQVDELRKAIAELSGSSDLSAMVLYVPPTDVTWEASSALDPLWQSSARRTTSSSASAPHRSHESATYQTPCSVLMRETQKATRSALIAQCCMRGMRLTFVPEAATHVLTSPPTQRQTPTNSTTHGHSQSKDHTHGRCRVGNFFTAADIHTEGSTPDAVFVDRADLPLGEFYQPGWTARRNELVHRCRHISQAYLHHLINMQYETPQV